jgi:peroxiredoxin
VTVTLARLIGRALPDLALPATGHAALVRLDRLTGMAVLWLYPYTGRPGVANPPRWDDIPGAHGSTPQAEGFRDHHAAFASRGIAVYGVGGQSTAWQQELSDRLGLPYPLLSDADLALVDALGLPTFETGGVRYIGRTTLVVTDGRIVDVVHPVTSPATHAADLLARRTA